MDFYTLLRQRMINTMQISLKQIRQILPLGVQELGDIVGLTRQSINNLESSKIKMSTVQFIAFCAVIDSFVESQPELMQIIISILNSNDTLYNDCLFDDVPNNSLLKKWFSCFPNNSKLTFANANIIDDLVENYKIFLDDTALCKIINTNQIETLISKMHQSGKRFIIPLRAIDTIQSQLLNEDTTFMNDARQGISNLQSLQELGISKIRGDKNDFNIITTLVSVFVKYKVVYRLALITQNRKLAKSILSLNDDEIGGFQILVLRCTSDYVLEKWEMSDTDAFQNEETETIYDDKQPSHTNEVTENSKSSTVIIDNSDTSSKLLGWETV